MLGCSGHFMSKVLLCEQAQGSHCMGHRCRRARAERRLAPP